MVLVIPVQVLVPWGGSMAAAAAGLIPGRLVRWASVNPSRVVQGIFYPN